MKETKKTKKTGTRKQTRKQAKQPVASRLITRTYVYEPDNSLVGHREDASIMTDAIEQADSSLGKSAEKVVPDLDAELEEVEVAVDIPRPK